MTLLLVNQSHTFCIKCCITHATEAKKMCNITQIVFLLAESNIYCCDCSACVMCSSSSGPTEQELWRVR